MFVSVCSAGRALLAAHDFEGVARSGEDFVARCGPNLQLRPLTYAAHMQLKEFDKAIQDASELIESKPSNAGYWVWRGVARQARGELEAGLEDLRQAFERVPEQYQVANHLATAYESLGRHCEALRTLQEHLKRKPESAREVNLHEQVQRLRLAGPCP